MHGSPAHRSLAAVPGPVDLAYVMVPTSAVLGVLREGAKLGIRSYVILTADATSTPPPASLRTCCPSPSPCCADRWGSCCRAGRRPAPCSASRRPATSASAC
ncbi:hypothetical protein [Nonomuraea guangzhouensis]|uniref:CoA-binding domain-containing protein n=1 Tax=Nonomuraea guangzhouensis TaxID=1291555 RepID=A0ABW4GFZ5_9ACTN|nr:hypothetical protein [Nonomuraea guangzhouensis]